MKAQGTGARVRLLWQLEITTWPNHYGEYSPAVGEKGSYVVSFAWDCPYLRHQWELWKAKSWVHGVRLVAWRKEERGE